MKADLAVVHGHGRGQDLAGIIELPIPDSAVAAITDSDRNDPLRAVHGVRFALKTLPNRQFRGGAEEPLVDRLSTFVVLGSRHVVCQHKQCCVCQQQFTSAVGVGNRCEFLTGRGIQDRNRFSVIKGTVNPIICCH